MSTPVRKMDQKPTQDVQGKFKINLPRKKLVKEQIPLF